MTSADPTLLSIEQRFWVSFGAHRVVSELSFSVAAGEKVGLVGESGTRQVSHCPIGAKACWRCARCEGTIRFEGEDLLQKSERQMRALRGG